MKHIETTHMEIRFAFKQCILYFYIIILFKEHVAFFPVTYASEHTKIRILQDTYRRLQDLTVIYASELKKILNFERTHIDKSQELTVVFAKISSK